MAMASTSIRMTRTGVLLIAAGFVGLVLYSVGLPILSRLFEQRVSMKALLSVSIDVARKGGERVKAVRLDPNGVKQRVKGETKEGAKEMLTAADLESHRVMHGGLTKAFAGLKIISEEHDDADTHVDDTEPEKSLSDVDSLEIDDTDSVPLSDITVWIDPLDATQEFTENLTEYVTTMVCVAVRGKPVIGVVYQPFTAETTWGYVDHGVSRNLKSVKTSTPDAPLDRIVVSRSHAGHVHEFIKSSKSFGKEVQIIPAGGAGYKVLQVVHGKADAYVHVTQIKKWDICAGNALIAAMRGQMTTLKDAKVDYSASDDVINSDGLLVTQRLSKTQRSSFVHEFSLWMLKRKPGKKD